MAGDGAIGSGEIPACEVAGDDAILDAEMVGLGLEDPTARGGVEQTDEAIMAVLMDVEAQVEAEYALDDTQISLFEQPTPPPPDALDDTQISLFEQPTPPPPDAAFEAAAAFEADLEAEEGVLESQAIWAEDLEEAPAAAEEAPAAEEGGPRKARRLGSKEVDAVQDAVMQAEEAARDVGPGAPDMDAVGAATEAAAAAAADPGAAEAQAATAAAAATTDASAAKNFAAVLADARAALAEEQEEAAKELMQASKEAEVVAATARTLAEFKASTDQIRTQLQARLAQGQQPQAPQQVLKPTPMSIKNGHLAAAAQTAEAEADAGAAAAAPTGASAPMEGGRDPSEDMDINSTNNRASYLTGLAALRHPSLPPWGFGFLERRRLGSNGVSHVLEAPLAGGCGHALRACYEESKDRVQSREPRGPFPGRREKGRPVQGLVQGGGELRYSAADD